MRSKGRLNGLRYLWLKEILDFYEIGLKQMLKQYLTAIAEEKSVIFFGGVMSNIDMAVTIVGILSPLKKLVS